MDDVGQLIIDIIRNIGHVAIAIAEFVGPILWFILTLFEKIIGFFLMMLYFSFTAPFPGNVVLVPVTLIMICGFFFVFVTMPKWLFFSGFDSDPDGELLAMITVSNLVRDGHGQILRSFVQTGCNDTYLMSMDSHVYSELRLANLLPATEALKRHILAST